MLQVYVSSVSIVSDICFKCFIFDVAYVAMAIHACFKRMCSNVPDVFRLTLQVFYLDVVKVDLNVAYVALVMHTCFKCFICFRTYVANVLFECCK
jgi:hypothetical protein